MTKWERDPSDTMAQIARSNAGQHILNNIKTEGCPSMEVLDLYVHGKLSQEQIEGLKIHVIFCDNCAKELVVRDQVAKEIMEEELLELAKQSYLQASQKAQLNKPPRFKSRFGFLRSVGRLQLAMVAVSVFLVIGTILVAVVMMTRSGPQNSMTSRPGGVVRARVGRQSLIIQPSGKVPSVKTVAWKLVPGADAYSVRVLDLSSNLIWEAKNVTGTTVTLPDEIIAKLKKNTRYRWQVRAYYQGQELTFDEGEFSLSVAASQAEGKRPEARGQRPEAGGQRQEARFT